MIRRHPPRPSRRQHQDFHFFAAPDPIANLESQFTRPAAIPPEPSRTTGAVGRPEPPTPEIQASLLPGNSAEIPAPAPPAVIPNPVPVLSTGNGGEGSAFRSSGAPLVAPSEELRPRSRAAKPRPKPRARKTRTTARLATPRRNHPSPARQSPPPTDSRSDHERHCTVCSHPDRAEIENEFMHWHTVGHIAYDYKISRSAICRHAHASGHFARRNRNLRFALGHLIERVQDVDPTADSIVRAVHAFARINDEGEWVEPPAHVIVSSGSVRREAAAGPSRRPIAIPLNSETFSGAIDVTPAPVLPPVLPGTVNRVESDATR
jgi:hypothetical protein